MKMLYEIDFIELFEVVIRSLLSLFVLFIATKIIGKKQVSELSLFDYVIGISMGNFAAEISLSNEIHFVNSIAAVVVFSLISYLVSFLSLKSLFFRRLFVGKSTILIQNGNIIKKNLWKVKMDVNELLQQARVNNIFDLSEVLFAIMEANGQVSFLQKSIYRNLTPNDMKVDVSDSCLCANVVIDGKILEKNLLYMNKDSKWLLHQLKVMGINDLSNILLVTMDNNDKLTVYNSNVNMKSKDILE